MVEADVRESLRQVIDPELGVNIVDLGLVYGIEIDGPRVRVAMTMTSPACPLGEYLRDAIAATVTLRHPEATDVETTLVWEPEWNPEMMSPDAKRMLGWGD